uniref:Uncharacterized protein n=1 Tax=Pyricularia oryzae (strain P131) TaxID=1143193 RepID=L7IUU2_PYRO1
MIPLIDLVTPAKKAGGTYLFLSTWGLPVPPPVLRLNTTLPHNILVGWKAGMSLTEDHT